MAENETPRDNEPNGHAPNDNATNDNATNDNATSHDTEKQAGGDEHREAGWGL